METSLPVAIALLRNATSVLERFKLRLVALQRSDREFAKWFVIDGSPACPAAEAMLCVKPTKRLAQLLAAFEAACLNFDRVERSASTPRSTFLRRGKHDRRLVRRPGSRKSGGAR